MPESIHKTLAIILIATVFSQSAFLPAVLVFGEEATSTQEEVIVSPTETISLETEETSTSTSAVIEEAVPEKEKIGESLEELPQEIFPAPQAEKLKEKILKTDRIKTDKSLSLPAQLSKVRQDLKARGLPQEIIARIDEFEQKISTTQEEKSLLQKLIERAKGETPEQKERAYIEKESRKRPFSVITADETPRKRSENDFNNLFQDNIEKKSLRQKIKDLLEADTLKEAAAGFLRLAGLKEREAIAQAGGNPNDYLAEEGGNYF